jgi:hypothetical protein
LSRWKDAQQSKAATKIEVIQLKALALYDWRTHGKPHPATLWAGLLMFGLKPFAWLILNPTPAWQAFRKAGA